MQMFPESFLILFYQVAVGGLFAIAATPFHELERGFYKSTAGVLFVLGLLGLWGKIDLYGRSLGESSSLATKIEIALYILFLLSFALYLYSLWGEKVVLRARAFAHSLFLGVAGLCVGAQAFHRAPFWSIETLIYPLGFVASSLLLGGVTVGMLIGHWYLIDTGQSIDPFVRIFKFFLISLLVQAGLAIASSLLLYVLGTPAAASNLELLWENHRVLFLARLLIGQVCPLVLSYMIWRTLKIPHTMAATGLFYIALLGVFVGEILGRQILALTSLPL
jgi:hypothetical protein